jgi:predicted DNA-binding transcriptional regulator AlpA
LKPPPLRHLDPWQPLSSRCRNLIKEAFMVTNPTGLPQRYLRTPEAARFVGLSIRTLEKHRIYGTGPRYSKLGGRVVYRVEDLQAWVDSGAKASTSDPGVATVLPAKRQSPLVPPPADRSRR